MVETELPTESKLAGSRQLTPLVSIGIPVYNEEHHLGTTLDSLLTQDYENVEIIISDNASTDRTPLICQEYLAKESRIRYHRNETNLGSVRNFNRVFELAKGELFMWASGHDLYDRAFITTCLPLLLEDSSIVLCHPQVTWIDVHGKLLESIPDSLDTRGVMSQIRRLNMVLWQLSRTAFPYYGMHRSSALRQTALQQQVAAPDVALLAELSLLGTFAHVSKPLFFVRKPTDWGSWKRYVEKHFKLQDGWSAQLLFWRMAREMVAGVLRHVDGLSGKAIGVVSVILCMFLRYSRLLIGLLSVSVRRTDRNSRIDSSEIAR